MNRPMIVLLLFCGALLFPPNTSGAPINFSESVSGDLGIIGTLTTLSLDFGTNTISGTVSMITNDFDSFAFTVPTGGTLTFGQVALVTTSGPMMDAFWRVRSGADTHNGGTQIDTLSVVAPGSDGIDVVPLGPGLYSISHVSMSAANSTSVSDWTVTLTVVPEPASCALTFSGAIIVASALIRRKRRGAHDVGTSRQKRV